jgi:NAD(P)-dependent dehydrogenase (short-subunit alcohol dehydrogenase family)
LGSLSRCDVTSLSGLRTLAAKLRSDVPALNYLYLSPGILTTQGRTETADGNDIKMMLHLYSRMFLIRELVPSLRAVKGKGEEARVLSVLDSKRGNFDKLVWDDLELKKSYSLGNAGNHCITMNDIMIKVCI